MTEDLNVADWVIPGTDLEERFSTTGGPGGQHANRSQTAVTLRFEVRASSLPDDVKQRVASAVGPIVEVTASESRSQWRNRSMARRRMVERLEEIIRPVQERKPTKKPRSADQKRLDEKKARADVKKGRRPPRADED